ncbi:MAG: extracellular solute-binding protein [Halobacteriales archaeon]
MRDADNQRERTADDESNDGSIIQRRKFLKGIGATGVTAGLAGCGGDGGGSPTETPKETSTEMTEETSTETMGGGGQQEEVTLSWVVLGIMKNNEDATKQALRDAGLPDYINLELLSVGNITDQLQSKYNQWLTSQRETPTLLTVDNGWSIPFIVRGQFLNLTKELSDDKLNKINNEYFTASVNTAKHPSTRNLYAVPMFPEPPTIQYRKDLVEAAGYDPEGESWATNPLTWKRFSKIAKDVRDQSDAQFGYTWQGRGPEQVSCCAFPELFHSWGGSYVGGRKNLFGNVGDRPITVDEQPVVDSIRMARTFIYGSDDPESLDGYEQISPDKVISWKVLPSASAFREGNAVFHRQWTFNIPLAGAEDVFGKNLGVMPMPYAVTQEESEYPNIGGSSPALGGWHVAVNPFVPEKKRQAALDFFDAFMSEEFMLSNFEINGWMPPQKDLVTAERARNVPVVGRYTDTLQLSMENAVPRPVTPVWPRESDLIFQEFDAAIQQKKTPQKAMSDLKGKMQQVENAYTG